MDILEYPRQRARTLARLVLAFGLFLGACSAETGIDDGALAFDDDVAEDEERAGTDAEDPARAVDDIADMSDNDEPVGEDETAAPQAQTLDPVAELEETAPGTVGAVPTTAGTGEELAADSPEGVGLADEDAEAEASDSLAADAPEADAPEADAGTDSELVGTVGVTARDLMRNLALELGGSAEILTEPERTDSGGGFAFALTGENGAVREFDVSFSYVYSPDFDDLIEGHEATAVSERTA